MGNIGSYASATKGFDWKMAGDELGYGKDGKYNIGYFCTDRICDQGNGARTALIWQSHTGDVRHYSYDELRINSNTCAVELRRLGLQAGDRICLFMDRIPELYFFTLGILKMGSIAQPLFSAFGEEALATRLEDAQTKAVITTRKHLGKVRRIRSGLPELKWVIVVDAADRPLDPGEIAFSMENAPKVDAFEYAEVGPETPSILHYTSGTTGKPKGALHVHSSVIAQAKTAQWVLDVRPGDIYWCTADPGWVTGTSYGIIGPWTNGVTQVILDAGFSARAWYAFIEKHKVTVWYTSPTAIRMLMKEGADLAGKFDMSSLRHMISVGEPLNAEAVVWSEKAFGKPFHDSYWQTETGSIMISNYPGMKVKPGSMGKPFPGIIASVLHSKTFEPLNAVGEVGLIGLRPGWPSMFRTYWHNEETYRKKFCNGWYISGDRASIDSEGYYWFVGRDDDVINTAGHLVGPFEIESALLEHPSVAESAAVGKPDEINMEVVKVFIALKPGVQQSDQLTMEIMNHIRKRLSPQAMPQAVEYVPSLPKTRSGKIMRRVLRAKEWGEEIGDISSLEND